MQQFQSPMEDPIQIYITTDLIGASRRINIRRCSRRLEVLGLEVVMIVLVLKQELKEQVQALQGDKNSSIEVNRRNIEEGYEENRYRLERETHWRLLRTLEEKLEDKTTHIDNLMAELNQLRQELKESRQLNDELTSKNQELAEENASLSRKYETLLRETEASWKLADSISGSRESPAREKSAGSSRDTMTSEVLLWKSRYQDLQQRLANFNMHAEQTVEATREGNKQSFQPVSRVC